MLVMVAMDGHDVSDFTQTSLEICVTSTDNRLLYCFNVMLSPLRKLNLLLHILLPMAMNGQMHGEL